MAKPENRVACRTPAEGRDGVTNIPVWKFDAVRLAILAASREPIAFADLREAVVARLTAEELANLGSPGWHVTVVKLELEVRGEVERLDRKGPQWIRAVQGIGADD